MNITIKMSCIGIMVIAMMIIPTTNVIMTQDVVAQSQSATVQQTSQPPTQNNSKPQVGQVFTFNEKSKPANEPEKCAALASEVKGKALPDYNLCDVVVYRQAPAIVRHDGLVLNNFSGIGHYIEMVPASVLNNSAMYAGNSSNGNSNASESQSSLWRICFD